MSSAAVFAKKNPLPGSQQELPIADRNRQGNAEQGRFDVSRHVIRPFAGMVVRERFRRDFVGKTIQIRRNVRIDIFIERQRRRGMLQKKMQKPRPDCLNFWNCSYNVGGNLPNSLGTRRKRKVSLRPKHGFHYELRVVKR